MTFLKKKNLKITLILIITSLVFLFMNWKSYYITYNNNPNSLLKIMSCKWYEYIYITLMYFLKILVIYIFFLKIAKYIAFKISKSKYRYLITFVICYIEVAFLFEILFFYLTHSWAQLSPKIYINIGIYSILFVIPDYLFSKMYKNFNTLRTSVLNACCNVLVMVSLQIFLVYFH